MRSERKPVQAAKDNLIVATKIMAPMFIVGIIIALAVPENVLSKSMVAKSFCQFMDRLVPMIGNVSIASSFPEVCEFTLSVMWALVPIQVIVNLWIPGLEKQPIFAMPFYAQVLGFTIFIVMICWTIFIFGYDFEPSTATRHQRMLLSMTTSRAGLGFWAAMFSEAAAFVGAMIVVWFSQFLKSNF